VMSHEWQWSLLTARSPLHEGHLRTRGRIV
jgi:hypothetical protein